METGTWLLQTPVQRYWKNLLKYVEKGKLPPEMVRLPA